MPGEFLRGLEQPEYVHVLLNPLPVYGLAMGLAALMIAMALRSREARICACAIIFLSSASAWPVSHYGQQGYFRVKAMSDSEGKNWLEEHKRRGEDLVFAFYIVAAIALFSLGAYIGYAGGHIRHREFRFAPAPDRAQQEQQASD